MTRGTITYTWHEPGDDGEISPMHDLLLREEAIEHIYNMLRQGYREGQLLATIEDSIYLGHWNYSQQ